MVFRISFWNFPKLWICLLKVINFCFPCFYWLLIVLGVFGLGLLLVNVRGSTSFEQLRTVDGYLCATYREACQLLHLLENNSNWNDTIKDSVISSSPHQIRTLFSIILLTCFPSNPKKLWENNFESYNTKDCRNVQWDIDHDRRFVFIDGVVYVRVCIYMYV